jgi:hypothetical protein
MIQGGEGTELCPDFTAEVAPEGSMVLEHDIRINTEKRRIKMELNILNIGNSFVGEKHKNKTKSGIFVLIQDKKKDLQLRMHNNFVILHIIKNH